MNAIIDHQRDLLDFAYIGFDPNSRTHQFRNPITGKCVAVNNDNLFEQHNSTKPQPEEEKS